MEQLQGIFAAFVEMIEKLVGDNDALKGIIDTIKKIFGALNNEPEETTEG